MKIPSGARTALITTVAVISFASAALAADMPVKARMTASAYDWSGFYAGINMGYGWAESRPGTISFYNPGFLGSIEGIDYKQKGIIGGVQAGYNHQFNNMLLGVEADFSGTQIKGSVTDTINAYAINTQIDWLATVRGRAGVVVDRALIYVTGGLAISGVKTTLDDYYTAGTVTSTNTATRTGWTIGGGAEVAVARNWTLKGEYLYVDLGAKDFSFHEAPPRWDRIAGTASMKASIARLGLNYRF